MAADHSQRYLHQHLHLLLLLLLLLLLCPLLISHCCAAQGLPSLRTAQHRSTK
jgi:hypothetical protein